MKKLTSLSGLLLFNAAFFTLQLQTGGIIGKIIDSSSFQPLCGMEGPSAKNDVDSESAEVQKPTFGKLKSPLVWASLIALKKSIVQELPCEIFLQILEDYLLDPKIEVLDKYNNKKILYELESKEIRANVALEFLADPYYNKLLDDILGIVKKSNFAAHVYFLSYPLGYPTEVPKAVKSIMSPVVLQSLIIKFSDNPSFIDSRGTDEELPMTKLGELFTLAGLNGNSIDTFTSHLTKEDYEKLLRHMFSTKAHNFEHDKIRHTLMLLKQIVINSEKHNIDLNFENEEGLTPLIWTETLKDFWKNNGHTDALREVMINRGANVNYKNRLGKTFMDVASDETIRVLRIFHLIPKT